MNILRNKLTTPAVVGLALMFAGSASAACAISMGSAAPKVKAPIKMPLAAAPGQLNLNNSIVGLWYVTVTSGGQTVDAAFEAWNSDGTEVLNDATSPILGNVCLGVWKRTGVLTYSLYHPSWSFDSNGNLLGTVIIQEQVKLDAGGNSFSGTSTLDVYDLSGNLVDHEIGEVSANRITGN